MDSVSYRSEIWLKSKAVLQHCLRGEFLDRAAFFRAVVEVPFLGRTAGTFRSDLDGTILVCHMY